MEQASLLPIILSFLGGGTVLAVVNYFINRRRAGVEVGGLRDDQTAKWRDDALRLSGEIMEKNKTAAIALRIANQHLIDKDNLQHQLDECLDKTKDCKCK